MATPMMGFRATPERREKLVLLAQGEGVTISDILNRLIDNAKVKPVQRVATGLALMSEEAQPSLHREP